MDTHPLFQATILTLFPEMFPGPLGYSLAGKALDSGVWSLNAVNIKEFGIGKHKQVDDTPYGGGAGMVMRPDVLSKAVASVCADETHSVPHFVYLTPRGKVFNQQKALEFTKRKNVVIVCGRFEGVDERFITKYGIEEVSVGDFILSGGEVAAMTVLDACVRLLPGVLGSKDTLVEESFSEQSTYQFLLEYPQYTRPAVWDGDNVPEVLLSGDHKAIDAWRLRQAETITKERRKDLWERYQKFLRT